VGRAKSVYTDASFAEDFEAGPNTGRSFEVV
jgi:hypothetical protein